MSVLHGRHIDIRFLSIEVLMLFASPKGEGQVCMWKLNHNYQKYTFSSWCDGHIILTTDNKCLLSARLPNAPHASFVQNDI